ncbi:MAG: hypothetical protein ACI837_002209 [Crocinitomicaceae bacterium]|jgi:hypothetical protein
MRIFNYWEEVSKELLIDNFKQVSKAYGGSNISSENAILDGEARLDLAQNKIDGSTEHDYEVNIVEEIIHEVDEHNIVTRNRYGALVLNSKHLLFIDIDDYSRSFLGFFRKRVSNKEYMLKRIEKTATKTRYSSFGFRVYETSKGYRVLVTNKDFDPRSRDTIDLMKDFNVDRIYMSLCIRQNCFRARLTPKPYRIRQKGIKVQYPHRSPEEEVKMQTWISEYDEKSRKYSTCKLVSEFGTLSSDKVVSYHNEMTGIKHSRTLA